MTLRPRDSFTSNDLSSCEWNEDEDETDYEGHNRRLILPPPLADEEILSIKRAFNRANRRVEGYLDSDELQEFMKLRKSPISLWEAKIILQYADKTYHYYISLNQIVQLATLYGLGTRSPIRLNRDEFKRAMKQAFISNDQKVSSSSSSNLSGVISSNSFQEESTPDFKGIVDFFESKQQGINNNDDVFEKTKENDEVTPCLEETKESQFETRFTRDKGKICTSTGSVKSMTGKWECAIKANNSEDLYVEDYRDHNELLMSERETIAAEKPYEFHSQSHRQVPKSIKSVYRRRDKSFDKLLFQEMLAEAKQHGLRLRKNSRSCSRNTKKSFNSKDKKRTGRDNSSKSRPPTPPCPIIPDMPEEWL